MLRAKFAVLGLVPALAFVACGADTGDEPAFGGAEQQMLVQPVLAGTFMSDKVDVGELAQLVVKTDGTFHSTRVVACFTTPCDPIPQDGLYRLLDRDGMRFINLYDSTRKPLDTYQFVLEGDALRLRRASTAAASTWRTMLRSTTAWCASPADCAVQRLPTGPCAGTWTCERDVCGYQCRPMAATSTSESGG